MIKKTNVMVLGVFLLIRAARVLYTPLSLSFVILCRDSVGSLGPIFAFNEAEAEAKCRVQVPKVFTH